MKRDWGRTGSEKWRWEAAKLRARAAITDDPAAREQLSMFAEDCEAEARLHDRVERINWRRA
jgi:hypothetical protein